MLPTICQIGYTVPYAPCDSLARYECVACDLRICAKHTILHREETNVYKVGFVCLACSNAASDPKAEACILDCEDSSKTYRASPDDVQLRVDIFED